MGLYVSDMAQGRGSMADLRALLRAARRSKPNFSRKLVFGAVLLSVLGIGVMLAIAMPVALSRQPFRCLPVATAGLAFLLMALLALETFFTARFSARKDARGGAEERLQAMLDSSPLACSILDESFNVLEVNHEMLKLLELEDRQSYVKGFWGGSPAYQPDGRLSEEKFKEKARLALDVGKIHFEWMCQTPSWKTIPCEKTVVRVTAADGRKLLLVYVRDLREINDAVAMVRRLESLAFTDALTGARNRRYFNEAAEQELRVCIDSERDFSIIMFDIDHFKRVNDTYGHDAGDEVLKIVVARACHTLKKDTLLARYGGEEFIVALPNVAPSVAAEIASHIRERIARNPFLAGDQEIAVTVSLGVASRAHDRETLQDVIRSADKALYRAKQSGRNKVVSSEDM